MLHQREKALGIHIENEEYRGVQIDACLPVQMLIVDIERTNEKKVRVENSNSFESVDAVDGMDRFG